MMLPQGRPMTAPEAGPPVRKPRAWALPTTALEAAPTMRARGEGEPQVGAGGAAGGDAPHDGLVTGAGGWGRRRAPQVGAAGFVGRGWRSCRGAPHVGAATGGAL